ncbi:transcription factor/nuclear export subunit protein 2-domain-containing protein [Suillus americanus]|nr:transcription factor/nuclear export subunit protein 2-domain-containing protein [Suillus americanus]
MDVVTKVEVWIANWSKEGESELRNFLISPHSNSSDPICAEALTTAYHALLLSVLTTWQPKQNALNAQAFVAFIQSVLLALPSSSSARAGPPVQNIVFGEILVDVLWATDAQLDEFLADAKSALVGSEQASGSQQVKDTLKKDTTDGAGKAALLKHFVEQDKETLSELVKRLLFTGIVDLAVCRERLDLTLLASAGLFSDRMAFDRKEIRTRTGLFYKQNKFNLLREQSEGYSKLSVELTSSLGPAHSHADARPVESYASIEDRARQVWEKVISLIGYFDLDPNRALDIILDVLSVNVATHYTFFLALLSFSPWTGLYRRPAMSTASRMAVDPVTEEFGDKSLDEVLQITEANASDQSTPLSENDRGTESRVLAQVLGFKFSHYQSSETHEPPLKNLYLTAAILIREGFITVEDLYPHLVPRDADIETYHKDYLAQVQQRISDAKISQLAMAAPLESSSSSSQPRVEPTEVKKSTVESKPPNQIAGLVNGLLSVGALRPAIAILTRIPWLVDAHPELADLILRALKYSIAPLYDATFVLKERNPSFTQPRTRFSPTGTLVVPIRKYQLSLIAPTPPSTASVDFVFFFPDWTQRIPLCTSFNDMVNVIEPLMSFIGLHISRDALFVTKITRLGRSQLLSTIPLDPISRKPSGEPDANHPVRQFWFKLLRLYFLPALPLIRGNAVCTVDIWNVIRQYETTARWRLYGEWKSCYISHPELRIRQVQADRESKGILRRLSHNTIETLSGTVAKLAHSNPCIFFMNAVNQIMAYDNLANVVIQALRYVTNMGFDVLVYVILEALSNPNKNRVKDDGVNTSDWLQSLASFTGMLFRRYSADLSPLLKYVVHQLYNGQTTEIVVLRELIWKMAGIEPLPSLSDPQIAAMAGGPALRIEAVASTTRGARLDPGDAVLKGPQRLGKTMLETNLALPLLIQVAQQRQSCVFKAPDAHLKSLASLFDTTHGVLLQYLDLLTSPAVISPKDYATRILPSLADLGELYGIAPPICMQIIRPMLNATILSAAQEKERLANEEAEKRLKARLSAAKREPSAATPRVDSPTGVNGANTPRDTGDQKSSTDGVPEDAAMDAEVTTATPAPSESPWIPDLETLFDDVKQIAKNSALDVIGPGFYLTFWQLSMYDLAPPAARYDEECAALRTLSRQEDSKYIAADRSADRTKRLSAGSHRAKRDRYNAFVNTLAQEFKEQTASRVFTMKRLAREKHHWFAHTEHRSSVLASAIIEHCIQPRCLLSPMDSDFCAQFIKVMHTQGTPGFPTLVVYDKLLGDHVKAVVFSCSEYEAKNYGRFLLGILTDLWKWAQDEQLFLMENRTKVGGKTILLPGFQHRWSNKDHGSIVSEDLLSWTGFKQILRKWHRKLGRSLLSCIETTEFMHVYNAIIVLKEILPVFPLAAVGDAGPAIDTVMEKFLEKEERGDLKILGRAYSASLKKREPFWTVPKTIASKSNGDPMSPKPANSTGNLPEKQARTPAPPNGAATPVADRVGTPVSLTSLRANGAASQTIADRPSTPATSTRLAIDSIPRPEKVRRVRPEKGSESPAPDGDAKGVAKSEAMDIDTPPKELKSTQAPIPEHILRPTPRLHQSSSQNALLSTPTANPKDAPKLQRPSSSSSATNPWEPPHSPRPRADEKQTQPSPSEAMPPPSAPSQTISAQELRETAKQSIGNRPPDRADDKRSQPGSGAPSPISRRRTPSPPPRPGTRTHSMESRGSGRRSDRGSGDGDRPDDRPSDREARVEPRAPTGRKDAATHLRSDRGTRDRTSTRDSDRDRESERDRDSRRDRHSERDRDRDREKERDRDRERDRERERDKDKDKDRDRRDRDRERDRDRDRDRDRHRRDEKDRDRDSRKDREVSGRGPTSAAASASLDTRNLPTRPDPTRHSSRSQVGDDALGKRRRPIDDEADRNTKRSSRKEGHREDRTRRSEKETHERPRESDRRREREAPEAELRHPLSERPSEKRLPEGPKNLPPSTPSAPRAMASGDASRAKPDIPPSRSGGDWKGPRDHGSHTFPASTSGGLSQDVAPSLRSRIGDKEPPRTPQASYRSEVPHKDDDRDNRKRTLAGMRSFWIQRIHDSL